jgi:hypothetical protein
MSQVGTASRNLPVAVTSGTRPASLGRGERGVPRTEFLSQLIAERDHLSPQRVRRQATPLEVLHVYEVGGKLKVRRMPPGYGLDIEA